MSKKLLLPILGLLAAALVAAACGSDPTSTPRPTAAPTNTAAPQATDTPAPPTPTLAPGETPRPTATPVPTARPTATPIPATATPGRPFYDGRTIRIIVPYSPGGGYDFFSRVVARVLPKHIPGQPAMIVENRPGAGGVIAANHLANNVKPDGLTISAFSASLLLTQLVGQEGVLFNARDFEWIGTIGGFTFVCFIRTDTGIRTIDDLIATDKDYAFAESPSVTWLPELLNAEMGTDLIVLGGYQGTADSSLAVDQGEAHGKCWQWTPSVTASPHWLESDPWFVTPLIQITVGEKHQALPDVPTIVEYKDQLKSGQAAIDLVAAATLPQVMERNYIAPPGTPPEILHVLQDAFWAMQHDPEFNDAIVKAGRGAELGPIQPGVAEGYRDQVLDTPPDIVEKLKELFGI